MIARVFLAILMLLCPTLAHAGGYGYGGYNYSGYSYSAYAPYSYSHSYSYPSYAAYRYDYWPGGYWQGCYYNPGYYKTYYPSYDYAVKYLTVPLFSAGSAVVPAQGTIPVQPAAPSTAMPKPAPAPAPTPDPNTNAILNALLRLQNDVNDLKRKKAEPERVPAPGSAKGEGAKSQPLTLLGIVQAKCAPCHDATVAKKEGKNWVATADGKLREWNDHDWRLVFKKVIDKGLMPPADNPHGIPPLTEAENDKFREAMNRE
jgi:hypothetical protein